MRDSKKIDRHLRQAENQILRSSKSINLGNSQRALERNADALDHVEMARAILNPPPPPSPFPIRCQTYKLSAESGMYPNITLASPGWRRGHRRWVMDLAVEQGCTHWMFDVRAVLWPTIFADKQPTFDGYANPRIIEVLLRDLEERNLQPIPNLVQNREFQLTGSWTDPHRRAVGFLREFGDAFQLVCLGHEINLFAQKLSEQDGGTVPPETYIHDMLMSDVNGLRTQFPDYRWGWHGQGWLRVPGAHWYGHQWDWHSHRLGKDKFLDQWKKAKRLAKNTKVTRTQLEQVAVPMEAAQHTSATEADAERLRGWLPKGDGYGF